jgi:hypothetical protein
MYRKQEDEVKEKQKMAEYHSMALGFGSSFVKKFHID